MEDAESLEHTYYLANKARIDSIYQGTEQRLDDDPDAIVVKFQRNESGDFFAEAELSREQLQAYIKARYEADLLPGTNEQHIQTATDSLKSELTVVATREVNSVLTQALTEHLVMGTSEDDAAAVELTFQSGTVKLLYKRDKQGRQVILMATKLNGMNIFGSGAHVNIKILDDIVQENVIISKIGDVTPFVDHTVKPLKNELAESIKMVLGEDILEDLKLYITGWFKDINSLDLALAGIKAKFQAVVNADVLDHMLKDIRAYALNAQANRELSVLTPRRPTIDKLNEMSELLEQL
jgi:hypothetical protein